MSGPMAGYDDFNRESFALGASIVEALGFVAVNPHDLDAEFGLEEGTDEVEFTVTPESRAAYMRRDVAVVAGCQAVAMLPGWEESTGANIELLTALVCGLEVWEFQEDGSLVVVDDLRPDVWRVMRHVEDVVGRVV